MFCLESVSCNKRRQSIQAPAVVASEAETVLLVTRSYTSAASFTLHLGLGSGQHYLF